LTGTSRSVGPVAGVNPVSGKRHLQRLVRPASVVLIPKRVDRRLRSFQIREHAGVLEQLPPQRLVEAFHLPGRGRGGRLGQPVHDPVLPTDPVEQHLPTLTEPVGELLTVISQQLLRHPEPGQALSQRQAHRPTGRPAHHFGDHREPGMIIHTGDDLHLRPVSQHHPTDDVHLPQLHRRLTLPPHILLTTPPPPGRGIQPVPRQILYTVIRDGTGPGQPLRPNSNTIRRAPHRGC
jgi:hypothetical protein